MACKESELPIPRNKSRDQQNFCVVACLIYMAEYISRARCAAHRPNFHFALSAHAPTRSREAPTTKKSGPRQDIAGSLQGRACAQESPPPQRWDLKTQPPPETTFQSVYECYPPFRGDFKSPNNKPFISAHSFVLNDSALPSPRIAP